MRQAFAISISVFALFAFISCHNNSNSAIVSEEAKTTEQIPFPGTRIYIAVPAGYTYNSGTSTFMKVKDGAPIADISLVEKKDAAFVPYNKEEFAKNYRGTVTMFENVKVSGYHGFYAEIDNEPLVGNFGLLIFGSDSFITSLKGSFEMDNKFSREEVRQALKTITYDKNKVPDPYETVPFKVNDSQSKYKLTEAFNSTFVYTTDGIKKDTYTILNDNVITISTLNQMMPDLKTAIGQIANMFTKHMAANLKVTDLTPETIKGVTYSGAKFTCALGGKNILVYLIYETKGAESIMLQASAHEKLGENEQEFKNLSQSITFNR